MSHFTVMAIGNDPAELLAPFHEFECTGQNDQFVQDVDITEEVQKEIDEADGSPHARLVWALQYNGLNDRTVLTEDDVDRDDTHKFGYAVVSDGKLIKAVKRTNPDAKWDWWVLGGRWSDSLLLKNGQFVNSAKIEDIDFEGMDKKARNKALEFHDKLTAYVADHPAEWEVLSNGPRIEALLTEIGEHNKNLAEGAPRRDFHEEYWTQDRKDLAKSLREAELIGFSSGRMDALLDASKKDRDSYADESMNPSWQTYAAVRFGQDGKPEWAARGEMGWWGMSSDTMTENEWTRKMRETLAELSGDTRISIIDCHI